jgi:CRP/FNR family transcriptional regulator, cyclic AMP receptor protein
MGMPAKVKAKSNGRNGAGKEDCPEAFNAEVFLTTVGTGRTFATYKPKSYIFRQGAKCEAVFYLQKGLVELRVVSNQDGKGCRDVGSGSFVGEACLGGHPVYLASARASTAATL